MTTTPTTPKLEPDRFDTPWGSFKRTAWSDQYGSMELLAVNRTSDGFLIGTARIDGDFGPYIHDVFLGRAPS